MTNTITLDGGSTPFVIGQGVAITEPDGYTLFIAGAIANSGVIQIQGSPTIADFTDVVISSPTVTLSGGGLIMLSNNGRNRIYTNSSGGVSLVNVDNTIAGAGQIGEGQGQGPFSLVNQAGGVVDANETTALNLYPGLVFTNAGLIEATNTGGLVLDAGFSRVVPRIEGGATGVIAAFGAGDNVYLNTIVISGGVLRTGAGGLIDANANGTLDGGTSAVTIDTSSTVQISPGGNLNLQGAIVNKGTLQLAGNPTINAFTDLVINSPTVTLTGGGLVALSDDQRNRIYTNSSGGVSLVNIDNTIAGAGQIGEGQGQGPFSLVNEAGGVVDANQTTALALYPGLVFTNAGTIEATNSGGLVLDAGFSRVIPRIEGSATGVIAAFGAGDNVFINTIVISGGILRTGGGGLIEANANGTLDGTTSAVTIDSSSVVQAPAGGNLHLQGAIVNKGTLQLAGNPTIQAFTDVIINSATATLTGGGLVALSDDTRNRIYNDGSTAATLVNIDNTIRGSGVIGQTQGQGPFALINAATGTIESAGSLDLFTAVTGAGTLKVDAGDVLELGGSVASGQSLAFGGAGATVSLDAPASFAGTILNFTLGETIFLNGPSDSLNSTFDGTTLTVDNQNGLVGTLVFAGSYQAGQIIAKNQGGAIVVTARSVVPDVSGSLSPANSGTLAAAIAALTPAGTSPNIVSIAGGGSAGAPAPGVLNGVAVSSSGAGATTMPAGFSLGFALAAAAALQDLNGGALLVAAGANDSLTGAANDTLIGGNGNATLTATTGAETLQGGSGSNAFFLGSSTAVVASSGNDVITGSSVAETVTAAGSALYFGTSGATNFIGTGTGGDTIIGGNGGNTITGGGGGQLVFGSSTLNYVGGAGAATIIGGGGGNTVTGGSGNLLLFASGSLTYTGTGGAATVIGGGGPLNAALRTGGGIAYGSPGGGDALSTSSNTSSILVGGGDGDVLSASGSGADILAAGGGAETINAATASGNLVIFGGPGPDVLTGGAGDDLFVAEPGNETLTGGGGSNSYVFINFGSATRTDVFTDFNPNRDAIGLFGYGAEPGADAAALVSATLSGGNTVVTLTDGTSLIFVGGPTLQSYNFF